MKKKQNSEGGLQYLTIFLKEVFCFVSSPLCGLLVEGNVAERFDIDI